MINPYESPRAINSPATKVSMRPGPWRTIFYGFGGAFVGYACLTILANLEDWQFYTIRSFVTGETAMSEITQHPADRWVMHGLVFGFILGGAAVGFWLARQHTTLKDSLSHGKTK
jgi:hypothetical protein